MQENTSLRKNIDQFPTEELTYLYDDGIFLFCAGKYEESIGCFDKIIEGNPASKIALTYKGLALQKLRRTQEAAQCYRKALVCLNE